MKRVGGFLGIAAVAYYALMVILYLAREVHGGHVSRVLRISVVVYYALMGIVYMIREVVGEDSVRTENRLAIENAGDPSKTSEKEI